MPHRSLIEEIALQADVFRPRLFLEEMVPVDRMVRTACRSRSKSASSS